VVVRISAMAQQNLDGAQVGADFEHRRGARVAAMPHAAQLLSTAIRTSAPYASLPHHTGARTIR